MDKKHEVIVEHHHLPDARPVKYNSPDPLPDQSTGGSQTTKTLVIGGILGVIITLVISTMYFLNNGNLWIFSSTLDEISNMSYSPQMQEESQTVSEQITATDDSAAGWKTYSGNMLSVKYPDNYMVTNRENGFYAITPVDASQAPFFMLDTRRQGTYSDYEQAVNKTRTDLVDLSEEEVLDNGVKFIGKVGPGYAEGQPIAIAILKHGVGAVSFEHSGATLDIDLFNQILSTIKFTN